MNKILSAFGGILLSAAWVPTAVAQASDEHVVLARLNALQSSNTDSSKDGRWTQPNNQAAKCEIYMWGGGEPSTNLKWFGTCTKGKATGLGVIVAERHQSKAISLEEYGAPDAEPDVVTYRQVSVAPQGTFITKGRITPGSRVEAGTMIAPSPKGNMAVTLVQQACTNGECVQSRRDAQSGSGDYTVSGTSGYAITWTDQRAENQPLFNSRSLMIDGALRAEKYVFDGAVYDIYTNLRTGQTGRINFSDGMNAALAQPMERFAAMNAEVMSAVAAADSKFAGIQAKLCRGQKDPDIRTLCDPSELIPTESALTAARQEINDVGRERYQRLQRNAAAGNQRTAQASQLHAQQTQQQALVEVRQREAAQESVRRGLEALNQLGINAQNTALQMQQTYSTPQVQAPTFNQADIVKCRTIGYITYCN